MNSVHLIGRLTRDPEVRYAGETAVCHFTLAVDREFKKDEADFIPCTVFGKQAENLGKYMAKGRQIAVRGRIDVSSYEKDGERKNRTTVIADRVEFLSGGAKDSAPRQEQTQAQDDYVPEGFSQVDEDVPF